MFFYIQTLCCYILCLSFNTLYYFVHKPNFCSLEPLLKPDDNITCSNRDPVEETGSNESIYQVMINKKYVK